MPRAKVYIETVNTIMTNNRFNTPAILADPFGLDQLIEWKMGSIRNVTRTRRYDEITEEMKMQRQFTIELRVDFADSEKLGPIKKTLLMAARHCVTTARLIEDNPKSTVIAVYSDDFFSGHQEISLMEDLIQEGIDAAAAGLPVEDTISSELMGALKDG